MFNLKKKKPEDLYLKVIFQDLWLVLFIIVKIIKNKQSRETKET